MKDQPDRVRDEKNSFMDADNAASIARLVKQTRAFSKYLGGPFPEKPDLSNVGEILDLACGPGEWALEVAHTYPNIYITGVDNSKATIEYARIQSQQQQTYNARFRTMDILQPFAFADDSFDLVNASLLYECVPATRWPALLHECARVLRPGGTLRLCGLEIGSSNGPSMTHMNILITQALKIAGMSFSPNGQHIGVVSMFGHFLRDVRCRDVHSAVYLLDYSTGGDAHADHYENLIAFFKLIQPLLVRTGVTTQKEVDILYQQVLHEMQDEAFCATMFYAISWGTLPKAV